MTATSDSWVALGDSFTAGDRDDPHRGGWVARAAAALVDDGLVDGLDNRAVSGVRLGEVLDDQATSLTGRHAIVSVIAGANDVLRFGLDPSALLAGVSELLAIARRHGRLVVTSTCPDFFARRYGASTRLSPRVDRLNEHVAGAAAAAGDQVLVLDTHRLLRDPTLWHDDGVHPNPQGHEALAAAALDLLRPRLATVDTEVETEVDTEVETGTEPPDPHPASAAAGSSSATG